MSVHQLIFVFLISIACPLIAEPAPHPQPARVVEDLQTALIYAMQGDQSYQWRVDYLVNSVESSFDFTTIARIAMGRNWDTLNKADRQALQSLMSKLVVSTYASRFKVYQGEAFTILKTLPIGEKRVQVRSRLTTREGEQIDLVYQLHQGAGGWFIFDIVANGVSDLSLKRAAYGAVFNETGLPGIVMEINNKIERNGSE